MTQKTFEWTCPKCEQVQLGLLPMASPGQPCQKCGYIYYVGKLLDEITGAAPPSPENPYYPPGKKASHE